MLEQLKRPFKKRYDKVRSYAGNFVGPVKESASKLFALFPKLEAFAGLEDRAEAPAEGAVVEGTEGTVKPGLKAKLKEFKASLKGLTDFQKLILLTIAVVLPAGIFIAVVLAGILHRHRK
ncbi:hypothetical protein [Fibrobacter sp. UWB5]|uniref:hypothetical protein n=1 Tax=Fibrobacter sp. UWB5 TaxID=1964360 RepID=UPI000B520DB2|nr:hypothetical protein [Fibrobacter sp. UWB5]OWV12620.1 hypothetical protein B7989_06705 [Fibrobacter sp. UWB5]